MVVSNQGAAPHSNFGSMNGPIPGEGLTNPPGSAPYQNPPQFNHLDDLLESLWHEMNQPHNTAQLYGLLKVGVPAEAIARTLLFGAFSHGVCTVDLAQLALKTVVRQVAALGHMLGVKNIKITNHRPDKVKQLADIAKALSDFGSVDDQKGTSEAVQAPVSPNIFSGLGA